MEATYFPLFIDLTKKPIYVIGGGKIALRRIRTLLSFAKQVTVISPEIEKELHIYVEKKQVIWMQRPFRKEDVESFDEDGIVLAATDQKDVNAFIGAACKKRGIMVNVADDRSLCDFFFPAIVKSEDVVIGINSSGKSPKKTKEIRKKLEQMGRMEEW